MQRSQPCSRPGASLLLLPSPGARGEESGGRRAGSGGPGEEDAKGKRRKRRRWCAELVLLQGLGGEGRSPARWPEHRRERGVRVGGTGGPPRLGKPRSTRVSAEAGPRVVTGNTFTIQHSLSLEQFPFSLNCGGFVFLVFVVFFFFKKKKKDACRCISVCACICVHE